MDNIEANALIRQCVIFFLIFVNSWQVLANTQEEKISQYNNPNALMTPKQLNALMSTNTPILLLDIRKVNTVAQTGRITSAYQLWRPDITAHQTEYGFGGMRASKQQLESLLSQLGATPDTVIIPYDNKGNYDAARLWWLLTLYGHNSIKLIDGGFDGWLYEGFHTTRQAPKRPLPSHYHFSAKPHPELLATLKDVQYARQTEKTIILDTRSTCEYKGQCQLNGAFRAGRIPGSLWLEYSQSLDTHHRFLPIDTLKKIYASRGMTPSQPIIAYCQSAVRSAHTTFVLTQLLGYTHVKNYDGSWIEWSYNKQLPIEVSAD